MIQLCTVLYCLMIPNCIFLGLSFNVCLVKSFYSIQLIVATCFGLCCFQSKFFANFFNRSDTLQVYWLGIYWHPVTIIFWIVIFLFCIIIRNMIPLWCVIKFFYSFCFRYEYFEIYTECCNLWRYIAIILFWNFLYVNFPKAVL